MLLSSATYDSDVTAAIKAAVFAGDPTCPAKNIWTYQRNLIQPTAQQALAIMGAGSGDARMYHGWDMTWSSSSGEEIEAYDDGNVIISSVETWLVRGLYSLKDELATDITFRKIVAQVQYQLRQHPGMLDLENHYQLSVNRASLRTFGPAWMTGTELVHKAEIDLEFSYKDHQ